MNFKTFGGKIVAGILAAVTMTTLAIPASANWCTHIYGSKHSYETQYNEDGEVTGQHLTRTTCAFCGAVNVHLDQNDPNYGQDVSFPEDCEYEETVVEPTCTEEGYTLHTCKKCGGTYKDDYTEPLGHGFDEGETILESTCNGAGILEHRCVRCGYHYLEPVSPEGHTPGEEATCTEPQVCTECGAVLALPKGHSYEAQEVAPTCTEFGYTVYTCSVCEESYRADYVPPVGHTESSWIIDKAATFEETGKRHKECEVCHEILAVETTEILKNGVTTDGKNEALVGNYLVTVTGTKKTDLLKGVLLSIDEDGMLTVLLPTGTSIDYADPTNVTVLNAFDREPAKDLKVSVEDWYDGRCIDFTDEEGKLTVPGKEKGSTDRDGRLTLGFVVDKETYTYSFAVKNDETGRPIRNAKISLGDNGEIKIDLPDGIDLDMNHRISVKATDSDGKAAEGLRIIMTNDLGNRETGSIDKEGNLTLPVKDTAAQQETKPEEKPDEQQQEVKTVTERHSAFIVGYPDGSFGPERNMSHAEAVAIFARLLADRRGETITNSGRTGYTDVADNAWYTGYVKYLMDRGVQVSNDNAHFKPDEAITRAEFVTLAVRFFDAYGNGNTEIMEQYVEFSDVSSGYWAARYIEDAAAHGWIKGYGDGTFGGEREITRAEVVTVVNRLLARSADLNYLSARSYNAFTDVSRNHWAYAEIMEAAYAHTADIGDTETWR